MSCYNCSQPIHHTASYSIQYAAWSKQERDMPVTSGNMYIRNRVVWRKLNISFPPENRQLSGFPGTFALVYRKGYQNSICTKQWYMMTSSSVPGTTVRIRTTIICRSNCIVAERPWVLEWHSISVGARWNVQNLCEPPRQTKSRVVGAVSSWDVQPYLSNNCDLWYWHGVNEV